MALFDQISRLVRDPAPDNIFELSENGMAYACGDKAGFIPFAPGTLHASPVDDNIKRPDVVTAALAKAAANRGTSAGKLRRAALILPDYAARVTVLDFDSFPSAAAEQLSLIRFRMKKTLPFDVESAAVSYFLQPTRDGGKKEVVAAAVALEVIARYETLFRSAQFQTGEVTTSSLAALQLYNQAEISVIAKLAGRVLTVMVVMAGVLKLFRCVEMERASEEEILLVLYPTLAYIEDELAAHADKLVLCGFPPNSLPGFHVPVERLESRFGVPDANNAGLFGYLEGIPA